jgi:RNA recognition motif-containing protein
VFDNGDDHLNSLVPSVGVTGNSSDPYNTTVFVGGLSALISEETLRSFFLPFGEIHYVSISVVRVEAGVY